MQIKYNGIVIQRARIDRFAATNEYPGESFNSNGRMYELEGVGVVHTGDNGYANNSADTIDVIRALLNQPRKPLMYRFDDMGAGVFNTLAANSEGNDGSADNVVSVSLSDSRNGPLTQVTITKMYGKNSNAAFFVAFHFKWFSCAEQRVQRFDFQITTEIDTAGFLTHHYSGTLEVSAAWSTFANQNQPVRKQTTWGPTAIETNDHGPYPDLYRRLVTPTLPGDQWRRQKQEYTVTPSLRTLTWNVTDKELFRQMPSDFSPNPNGPRAGTINNPDGDASFTFERSLEGSNPGLFGRKTFEMSLRCDRYTDPAAIIEYIFVASSARIQWGPPKNDIIESISISEPNIYTDNKVSVTIVARGTDVSTNVAPVTVVNKMFTSLAAQTQGATGVPDPYQLGQGYTMGQATVDPLKFQVCQGLSEVIQVVQNSGEDPGVPANTEKTTQTPDATLPQDTATDEFVKKDKDLGFKDNCIRESQSSQFYEIVDSGMTFIEPTGAAFLMPMQVRAPVVVVHQKVLMVTSNRSNPIPWPSVNGDPFIVKSQKIVVDHASPDAGGRIVWKVMAERTIQIQTTSSRWSRRIGASAATGSALVGGAESIGPARLVYSPDEAYQGRNPFSGMNKFNMKQVDTNGNETQQDFVG